MVPTSRQYEAVGEHAVARHDVGNDVLAEVAAGTLGQRIALKLLEQEPGVENVNPHRGQRPPGIARHGRRVLRLLDELDDTACFIHTHHPEFAGFADGHVDAGDGHVGVLTGMLGQHAAVVHLVDVVAGNDQDVLRLVAAQEMQVLVDGIGRPLVPLVFVDLLLRRQQLDELIETPVEEAPAALDVADQAVRLVLRGHTDLADAGIDAVGEREIEDAELAGKGHGRLGAKIGQLLEAGAASAGQDDGEGVARQVADEAHVALFPHFAISLMWAVRANGHGGPPGSLF